MAGPSGLTTEDFVKKVGWRLSRYLQSELVGEDKGDATAKPSVLFRRAAQKVDSKKIEAMFNSFDVDSSGTISLDEFKEMMIKLGLAPMKEGLKDSHRRTKEQEKTLRV